MTHQELVTLAIKWLQYRNHHVIVTELATQDCEEPDAIGWKSGGHTTLIECKTSRSDYLADKRKPYRRCKGIGQFRYYLTTPGVVTPGEVAYGWGLMESHGDALRILAAPIQFEPDYRREAKILLSLIRRGAARGLEEPLVRCRYYSSTTGLTTPGTKAALHVEGI